MDIQGYLNQIEKLEFYPLRDNLDIWVELQDEGIFEEYEEGNFLDNWVYSTLKISEEHKLGLKKLDADVVDYFNKLDIEIKDRYNLKIIDFINYDSGQVILVKYLR